MFFVIYRSKNTSPKMAKVGGRNFWEAQALQCNKLTCTCWFYSHSGSASVFKYHHCGGNVITAVLPLRIIIIIIIIIIISNYRISHYSSSAGKLSPILGYVINSNRLGGLIYNLKSFLQSNMFQELQIFAFVCTYSDGG